MNRKIDLKKGLLSLAGVMSFSLLASAQSKPNIVIIMADDLGYGSVNCYGADPNLVRTPHIDRLAQRGIRYTNAYSTASVSSPTRYSLLTGNYPFRSGRTSGVINPFDALELDPDKSTIADLMQQDGYNTATIGKWHQGYGSLKKVDLTYKAYTGKLTPGPLDVGYDYHFGMPQNHDDKWGVYIENDGIWGLKSDKISPYSSSYYGEQYVGFDAPQRNNHEIMEMMTSKAIDWLKLQDKHTPFFLTFNSVAVHHPITPSHKMRGTSDCGTYGDFIQELDECVGALVEMLEYRGLIDNTIIIFTSDNGGEIPANQSSPEDQAIAAGLDTNGALRGDKHTYFEGGVRVPFIVVGGENMLHGTVSDELVSMADIYATIAEILGYEVPYGEQMGADSYSFASTLYSQSAKATRENLLVTDANGVFAIVQGDWKYIDNLLPNCIHGDRRTNLEENVYTERYLFNLKSDPSESVNLYDKYNDRALEMRAKLYEMRESEQTCR